MTTFFGDIGKDILASGIYDSAKYLILNYLNNTPNASKEDLENYLNSNLNISGANISADNIINFLAENGDIVIKDTSVYAHNVVHMQSNPTTEIVFGGNSTSATKGTKIQTIGNAHIILKGGASIIQGGSNTDFTA